MVISVWWLLPAGMLGACIGLLALALCTVSSWTSNALDKEALRRGARENKTC